MSLRYDTNARGVATILLDRPDIGNRYDPATMAALASHLRTIEEDLDVRVLVLRGAGKHFCVGADIGWHAKAGADAAAPELGPPLSLVLMALESLSKPTIALVQGAAIGGGAALAACCDIVIADEDAFFSLPEVRIGLSPSALLPLFLRVIGARHLRRYALTGERISVREAREIGLVHRIVTAGEAECALAITIDALMLGGPQAQAALKKGLLELATPAFDEAVALHLEAEMAGLRDSAEGREGFAAFFEKRKPAWYRSEKDPA